MLHKKTETSNRVECLLGKRSQSRGKLVVNRWCLRNILNMSRDEAGRAVQSQGCHTEGSGLDWRFSDGVDGLRRLERF